MIPTFPSKDLLCYYTHPGPITEPGEFGSMLERLPADIGALCATVQGFLVHIFWAERYGLALTDARKGEVQLRRAQRQLARLRELSDAPLTATRPLEQRLVANCRDFSTLLCAILRHQGVPARARCGFGAYFTPGRFEDHWVCEYWNAGQGRWILVDAQLDALQREVLRIDFDPLDVPRDRFLTGGLAWQMCRSGQADPDAFGIFDMHGLWFVLGDLIRDFLALNKVELLPWDGWGMMIGPGQELAEEDARFLDHLAELTLDADTSFAELRTLFENDPRLRTPEGWQP
jgi:hypothetical protein